MPRDRGRTMQATRKDSKGARSFGRGSVGSQQRKRRPAGRLKQLQRAQGAGSGGNVSHVRRRRRNQRGE